MPLTYTDGFVSLEYSHIKKKPQKAIWECFVPKKRLILNEEITPQNLKKINMTQIKYNLVCMIIVS